MKTIPIFLIFFFLSGAFASVSVNFLDENSFTQTKAFFEADQKSWASWGSTDNNAGVKTIISATEFSAGLTISVNYPGYVNPYFKVNFISACATLAAYGYNGIDWETIGSFKSGMPYNFDYSFTKLAFQAQTSSTTKCTMTVQSISVGLPSEVVVTKVSLGSEMTDYKSSEATETTPGTISFTVPFKTNIDSASPDFIGIFKNRTPTALQNFAKGPVAYTFSSTDGSVTREYDISIKRGPADTNARLESFVGVCDKANLSMSGDSYKNRYTNRTYCSDSAKISHPKASGDTGSVDIFVYEWTPDSSLRNMHFLWSRSGETSGFGIPEKAKYFYCSGDSCVTGSSSLNLIPDGGLYLKIESEGGEPYYYYKINVKKMSEDNILYDIAINDTVKNKLIYSRTVYDPETPKDTGLVIYDLPYKGTVASKLGFCPNGMESSSCYYFVSDSSSVSVSGKISGTSGPIITLIKHYDKKTYKIKLIRQNAYWPLFTLSGVYAYFPDLSFHYAVVEALPGTSAVKFNLPMQYYNGSTPSNFNNCSTNSSCLGMNIASMDPFYSGEYDLFDGFGVGDAIKITATNEEQQNRIGSVTVVKRDELDSAVLRSFYVSVGGCPFRGKIDEEHRTVQVNLPFEINLKRAPIIFGGPEFSYSENFSNGDYYDLSEPFKIDIHSADSTKSAEYTVTVAYDPDWLSDVQKMPVTLKNEENRIIYDGKRLVLEGDLQKVLRLSVYDARGSIVYSRWGMESPVVDISLLGNGLYFVKMETVSGLVVQKIKKTE